MMGIVQTVPTEIRCDSCTRDVFEDGTALIIEGAINPEGGSEIRGQLAALRDSTNKSKRHRYYDLVERFEQLSAYGELEDPIEMRHLVDQLWEIKTGQDRVPFYFFEASTSHKRAARLTHQFSKNTGKTQYGTTPRKHLSRGLWIVKGDVKHG